MGFNKIETEPVYRQCIYEQKLTYQKSNGTITKIPMADSAIINNNEDKKLYKSNLTSNRRSYCTHNANNCEDKLSMNSNELYAFVIDYEYSYQYNVHGHG